MRVAVSRLSAGGTGQVGGVCDCQSRCVQQTQEEGEAFKNLLVPLIALKGVRKEVLLAGM